MLSKLARWPDALLLLGAETLLFVLHWPLWQTGGTVNGIFLGVIAVVALFGLPFGYGLKRGWSWLFALALVLVLPVGGVIAQIFFPGPLVAGAETPWWASVYFMFFPYGGFVIVSTFVGLAVRQARTTRAIQAVQVMQGIRRSSE